MASNLSDERNELLEDQEKLQNVLELDSRWETISNEEDDEDDDDDDQLLIDLDDEYQSSDNEERSLTPSIPETASHSQNQSIIIGDEGNGEAELKPKIVLPTEGQVVEQKADPQKTLALNRALQGILEEHIEAITAALEENREKQEKLEEDVADFSNKRDKVVRVKSIFRAPYFRHNLSYPPSNEDVLIKKQLAIHDISMKDSKKFTQNHRAMLRDAVIEDYLEQTIKPVMAKMEAELARRDDISDTLKKLESELQEEKEILEEMKKKQEKESQVEQTEKIKAFKITVKEMEKNIKETREELKLCKQELQRLEQEIEEKKNVPEDELLASVDPEKVDWMKIAKMNFGGMNTWLDCQKAWENFVCPRVNKETWSKEEEKKLVELVKNSESRDWGEIAQALGNGRTAYQCFVRYQRGFNKELKSRPWTAEEDAKLISRTNSIKEDVGYYAWAKVSALMDGRSPKECMQRFTRISPSQTHGRWTEVEDAKLVTAVGMVGQSWSKVAKLIGSRNMMQCRERYLNCLAPGINFTFFSYDEDVKLLKLYKEMGSVWTKMIPHFKGRTDAMLLTRYRQLQKWRQEMEWFSKQSDQTKKMLLGKSLTVMERKRLESKTKDYLNHQLGITIEDYKRQELDRQNGVDPAIIPPRPPRHLKNYRFGSLSKQGGTTKWLWKLQFHQHLSDQLHQLVKKGGPVKQANESDISTEADDKRAAEMVMKSVNNALKDKDKLKVVAGTRTQMKKIEEALNKAFLSEGSFSVQDILNMSAKPESKKKKKKSQKRRAIVAQLKNVLRKQSRCVPKVGRCRRFFERDPRPASAIEEELDELDHAVSLMLMKTLGTDVHYLNNSAKLRCLDFQEEIAKLPSYEQDPDFKAGEVALQEGFDSYQTRTDISDKYRETKLAMVRGRLKRLRKLFSEKHLLNRRIIENRINAFQEDADYFRSLMGEEKEAGVMANLSAMLCSAESNLNKEFEEETHSCEQSSSSSSSIAGHSGLNGVAATSSSNNASSSDSHPMQKLSSVENGEASSSQIVHQKTPTSSTSEETFVVPTSPVRQRQQRKRTRSSQKSDKSELETKKVKLLTSEEIAQERDRLQPLKKKIFTSLPLLPPNVTTLLSLRNLLLKRVDLIQQAADLYKPENWVKTASAQSGTADSQDTEVEQENGQAAEREESPSPWFQPSSADLLSAEASSFQGFSNRSEIHAIQNPVFDSTLEHPSCTVPSDYPLDMPGQLDSSTVLPIASSNSLDMDIKPIIVQAPTVEQKKARKSSSYEIVLAPTGQKNKFSSKRSKVLYCTTDICSQGELQEETGLGQRVGDHQPKSSHTEQQNDMTEANVNMSGMRTLDILQHYSVQNTNTNMQNTNTNKSNNSGMSKVTIARPSAPSSDGTSIIIDENASNSGDRFGIEMSDSSLSGGKDTDIICERLVLVDETDSARTEVSSNGYTNVGSESSVHSRHVSSPPDWQAVGDRESCDNVRVNVTRTGHFNDGDIGHSITGTSHSSSSVKGTRQNVAIADDDGDVVSEEVAAVSRAEDEIDIPVDDDCPSNRMPLSSSHPSHGQHNIPIKVDPHHYHNTIVLDANSPNLEEQTLITHHLQSQQTDVKNHLNPISSMSEETEQCSSGQDWNLPDLSRLRHARRSLTDHSNVVLVQVDRKSRHIVHFKQEKEEKDKYKVIETKPWKAVEQHVAEKRVQERAKVIERERQRKRQQTVDLMTTIRQSEEYKLLLARFRSLFMWPVLVSTVQPSPANEGSLNIYFEQSRQESERLPTTSKTNAKVKKSVQERKQSKAKRKTSSQAKGKGNDLTEEDTSTSGRGEDAGETSGRASAQRSSSQTPEDGAESRDGSRGGNVGSGNAQEADTSTETVQDAGDTGGDSQPKKRKRGRPPGSKNKKQERVQIERPKRNVQRKKEQETQVVVKEPRKATPKWWKDAVLAAMVSKKTLEADGELDEEVDIAEDEDFIDKGNYSDDEWAQELKASQ